MGIKWFSKRQANVSVTTEEKDNVANAQIQVSIDQLKAITEQSNMAAEHLQAISQENQQVVGHLARHSEQTNAYTQQVKEEMRQIQASAQEVQANAENVQLEATHTNEGLREADTSVQSLMQKMNELQESHHILIARMDELVEQSNVTVRMIDTIGGISQKTRILALNASIEATRAGEHGKGFQVVAKEVSKLADLTATAVKDSIENLHTMQKVITTSSQLVMAESTKIDAGTLEIDSLLQNFTEFHQRMERIQQSIQESNEAINTQRENIDEVTELLNEISDMSVNNTSQVLQVASSTNQQHISVEQLLEIVQYLTTTTTALQQLVQTDDYKVHVDQSKINKLKQQVKQYLIQEGLSNLDATHHQRKLGLFLQQQQHLEAVWSNRDDGTFIYSNPPAALVNAKVRPWFKASINGKEYISEVYVSAITKKACITISCPIEEGGKVVGVIGVDVSL